MINLEKAIIKAVNDLKQGFNPKVKCSVRKIILKRIPDVDQAKLNDLLSRLFKK